MANPVGIPVGTIVAYAADPTNLPDSWHVCDGSNWSTTSYPDLFNAIGYSNGGSNGELLIPDLQGRFIRGDRPHTTPVLVPGSVMEWSTGRPVNSINCQVNAMPTEWHYSPRSSVGPNMINWTDNSTKFPISGGDKETRPINTYLHYIIKVKSSTYQGDDIPIGGVFPFGGGESNYPNHHNYIRCDGTSTDRSRVRDLVKIVGDKYATNPNASSFFVPNLTGYFIRGVDPTATNDSDAGDREPAPDGSAHGIGTWQKYATSFKNAYLDIAHFANDSNHSDPIDGWHNLENESYQSQASWSGGDSESRPINAALYSYINAVDPALNNQVFPVGAIIAIPGTPTPELDVHYWLPCDGRLVPSVLYPDLFAAIGSTWGPPINNGRLIPIPYLEGYFLRGSDPTGVVDPDAKNRFARRNGGTTVGAGSYQNSATGIPQAGLQINISYPTANTQNTKWTKFNSNRTAAQPNPQYFSVAEDDWNPGPNGEPAETAPVAVVVKFYMRVG